MLRMTVHDRDFEKTFSTFLNSNRALDHDVEQIVRDILDDVRLNGDQALINYTKHFERLSLRPDTLAVPLKELEEACAQCESDVVAALEKAAWRIRNFHEKLMPENFSYQDEEGVFLGAKWTPVDAVGLYVPGGLAAYPSSVLMNAIPARVAGVSRLVMVVPTPDGILNPAVLAAAHIAGIDEIYRIGGAQAIGALAYGTATISPVDKIVGPGNAFVAAAKRLVFGTVGIDMIAGPSEILVIADKDNDPDWIAMDLLSQAEHDPSAQSILISDDKTFADKVCQAVTRQLPQLARHEIARKSWENNGAVILVDDWEKAIALTNRIAPEHLELAVASPHELAEKVRHAGAIFLGRHTPEAIGDYIAGPDHVLPTARNARFASGLGIMDFLKRTSLIGCNSESLSLIGPAAITLADCEELGAHAASIALRLGKRK